MSRPDLPAESGTDDEARGSVGGPAPDVEAEPRHDRRPRSERREHLDELLAAAVEAEIETGEREETVGEAERSLVFRVLRVTLGVVVTCVGISLLVLPGPGLIVIAGGLALMAQDVPFARRWLEKVRERIPEDEDGSVATWVIVLSVGALVASIAGSVWFTFFRS